MVGLCADNDVITVQRPVTIDLGAERDTRETLREKEAGLAQRADTAIRALNGIEPQAASGTPIVDMRGSLRNVALRGGGMNHIGRVSDAFVIRNLELVASEAT